MLGCTNYASHLSSLYSDSPDLEERQRIGYETQPKDLRGEELLTLYDRGGYHPITIDDVLDSRYQIRCKLGHGTYATVWLAENKDAGTFVSIKILQGDTGRKLEPGTATREHTILRSVLCATDSRTHPGSKHVIELAETFYSTSPNGRHMCIVMPLMASDLQHLSVSKKEFMGRPDVLRQVARQLLEGLAFLEEAEIVHTDIKLSNILVELDKSTMDGLVQDHLSSLDPLPSMPYTNTQGVTINYVQAMPIKIPPQAVNSDLKFNLRIADFGISCFKHETSYWPGPNFPYHSCPPEMLVDAEWGSKGDVWCLGHVIYELATHTYMLNVDMNHTLSERVEAHVRAFGPMPDSLLDRARESQDILDVAAGLFMVSQDGNGNHNSEKKGIPWEICLKYYMQPHSLEEREGLLEFLRSVFEMDPEKRPSAKELLQHDWLHVCEPDGKNRD